MTRNSRMTKEGKRIYKSCLGVHVCEKCDFRQAPVQPANKRKDAPPPPPKTGCPFHPELKLVHIPCTCTLNLLETDTHWFVDHKGEHKHSRPPLTGRLDHKAREAFENTVKVGPEATPAQLRAGTSTQATVGELSSALKNIDKIKHHRKTVLKGSSRQSSLIDIMQFLEDVNNQGFL